MSASDARRREPLATYIVLALVSAGVGALESWLWIVAIFGVGSLGALMRALHSRGRPLPPTRHSRRVLVNEVWP